LPLPIRMMGRDKVRWDEFCLALRKEVFINQNGQVALREARPRVLGLMNKLFGPPTAAKPPLPRKTAAQMPSSPPPGPAGKTTVPPIPPPGPAGKTTVPPIPVAPPVAPIVSPPSAPPVVPPRAPSPPPAPSASPAPTAPVPPTPKAKPVPPVAKPAPAKLDVDVMPVGMPAPPPAPGEEIVLVAAEQADDSPGANTVVGIDLGTTYSVVAHLDAHGRPVSVPNAAGDLLTPSVVLFDESGTVVGKEAVLAAAMEPEKIAECVKRDMGSRAYRKKIHGEVLPPEFISLIILKSLKADAERKLGPVRKAVITVPAYFDEPRRQSTIDAGRLAGLDVLDIINEPTAAAICYGYQLGFLDRAGRKAADKPLRVLVYDLGGGTFDVTIVEIQGTSFKALATDGDVALGGKDWDEKLVDIAAEAFIKEHREDPRTNPASAQDLGFAAEVAKKTLSERPKATLYVNHLGTRSKVEINRQQFEEATAHLLGRTRTTTEIVVRQAGMSWANIDKVLLVGGSTRMPMVVRMLEEMTGKSPERSVSPDEAVAHGAALYADLILRQTKKEAGPPKFSVTNINSHSLGIVGVDSATGRRRNQILIPKNTPLPHTVAKVFKTNKPNQPNIVIRVVEGESERPEACTQVGVCTIKDLPPNLPEGWPVQVSYRYETNGRLQVTVQLKGQSAGVTTTFQRENSLADEELKLWTYFIDEDAAVA
jgi:molecular chaperone DnaK